MKGQNLNRRRRKGFAIKPIVPARLIAQQAPLRPVTTGKGPVAPGTAPPAPRAPGVGTAAAVAPKPRPLFDDAQAAAERAAARFKVNQGTAELDQQGAYERTDFQEALRRMAAQRVKDDQSTREGANKQGLFYSGQLGKRLGDVATSYAEREGDSRNTFDRAEAARTAARAALQQGLSIEEAAISAQNAERQVERDSAAADVGGLVPTDAPLSPAARAGAKPAAKAKPKPKPKRRRRSVLVAKDVTKPKRRPKGRQPSTWKRT